MSSACFSCFSHLFSLKVEKVLLPGSQTTKMIGFLGNYYILPQHESGWESHDESVNIIRHVWLNHREMNLFHCLSLRSSKHGKVLVLDKVIQVTERGMSEHTKRSLSSFPFAPSKIT